MVRIGLPFAGALLLSACAGEVVEAPQPPLVRTTVVQAAGGVSSAYTGVVRARYEGDLGFRVGGKITERLVDAGRTVRRGQVIARLDASDLRLGAAAALADVAAAERSAAAARAEAIRLRADEARFAALQKRGFASGQRYEQARAGADAASANLAAAEAQVRAARAGAGQAGNQAAYAVLTADADGVVMDVLAEPGQVVGAGQPVVRLARNGAREAVVNTPETARAGLPRTGEAVLYGQEGRPVPAVLRELSAAADPVTRTFEARYTLGGAGGGRAARLHGHHPHAERRAVRRDRRADQRAARPRLRPGRVGARPAQVVGQLPAGEGRGAGRGDGAFVRGPPLRRARGHPRRAHAQGRPDGPDGASADGVTLMAGINLSAFAVRERAVTLFLIIAIAAAGLVAFSRLGRAEDPGFTLKVMTVVAVWPGATAEEMQNQVADRLEKRLQELTYFDRWRRSHGPGRSP
jgi:RND family efflux transporter MFP subunit